MRRLVILLLILSCLLVGCKASKNTEQTSTEKKDLETFFDEPSSGKEVGAVDFALDDPIDTVYSYKGNPLEIPFTITGASAGRTSEIGVLLLVDGVAQPYTIAYKDGTESAANYMQVFHLDEGEKVSVNMVFQPVTGKVGESSSIMAVTILEPSFLPKSENNPRYGAYHSYSATIPRQISFQTDAPNKSLAVSTADYQVRNLSKEVVDRLSAWGALEALDTTAELSLSVPDSNVIKDNGKTATVTLQLYGGPEANFNITLFMNHHPIKIKGADYLSVHTKKNKMVEATFQIDTADLKERNTIYAIAAAAGTDDKLEVNNPLKTSSVLMIHKEN